MTQKGFFISNDISADLNHTLDIVKNNAGSLNIRLVPIEAIEFDPENPRELALSRDDVLYGLKRDDLKYEIKIKELQTLQEMAESIKKYGIRNAVEIYKHGTTYRLIHGERRCLSSLLAGKKEIPAKILDEKPNDFDIKLLQLIENVQREDLTLAEFVNNVQAVINEYKRNIDPNVEVNASFIEQIINKSRAQCFNVMAILNAPEDIKEHIRKGEIRNLEKAAIIAKERNLTDRKKLTDACINGASLPQLKQMKQEMKLEESKDTQKPEMKLLVKKFSNRSSKIVLGKTNNKAVVSKIVKLVMNNASYSVYSNAFKKMDFSDNKSCEMAFRELIDIMERVEKR